MPPVLTRAVRPASRLVGPSIVLLLLSASASAQATPGAAAGATSPGTITIGGEVPRPLTLGSAELGKLPRRTVRASDHGRPPATYEGVALAEVLKLAGLALGPELRGKRMATYLLVEAADGYRAVFALPELDSAFTDKTVLLADRVDGKPLAAEAGPYRLVVPDEKRAARWVRQVTGLKVMSAPE